jgi:hypothetical protein
VRRAFLGRKDLVGGDEERRVELQLLRARGVVGGGGVAVMQAAK